MISLQAAAQTPSPGPGAASTSRCRPAAGPYWKQVMCPHGAVGFDRATQFDTGGRRACARLRRLRWNLLRFLDLGRRGGRLCGSFCCSRRSGRRHDRTSPGRPSPGDPLPRSPAAQRGRGTARLELDSLIAFVRLFSLGKSELAYPSVLARYGVAQARDGRRSAMSAWLGIAAGFLAMGDQVGLSALLGSVTPGGMSARTPAETTSRPDSPAKRDPPRS